MPNTPNPPKEATIDVILQPGSKPPFRFESKDITIGPDNHITFDNDNHDGFILHYRIKGPNHGYRFPDSSIPKNLKEALYVARGTTCPTEECRWGQFEATDVDADGTTLTVRNRNQKAEKGDFAYTLRVTNDSGASYLPLDPGGTNNNGSVGNINSYSLNTGSNFASYAIGAVVVVVVAAVALYSAGVFGR